MYRFVVVLAPALLLVSGSPLQASTWDIDPVHTQASFAVRHLMVSKVRGSLGKVTGTVTFDEADLSKSTAEATIDATTIDTREPKRDAHLKSPDFLDVAKYPTITFKSKQVSRLGDDQFAVTGDLTIHGVTREVVLRVEGSPKPFKDPSGSTKLGGMATTQLHRKDFGLEWNKVLETGGVAVGDDVDVTIDVELVKKAP